MDEIITLKPPLLWRHFHEISRIPRCSGREEAVRAYVTSIAKNQGANHRIDRAGNLVVTCGASRGREECPVVILQSHLDMVCEKNQESRHDFSTAPLTLKRQGEWVCAEETTLGADNGMGVAAALAVLEEAGLSHGPLELLFTVDEESGLTGARSLEADMLTGRMLINMDTEEHGSLYIGCAGGRDTGLFLETNWEAVPKNHRLAKVSLGGLQGGHSGIDIHEPRGNALKLLNRFLRETVSVVALRLSVLNGGSKHNAIPRESEAVFFVPQDGVDDLKAAVESYDQGLKEAFRQGDPKVFLVLQMDPHEGPKQVLSPLDQETLLNLLEAVPHGVVAMSQTVPGLVETSTNLAVVRTEEAGVRILTSQRSALEAELTNVCRQVIAAGNKAGAKVDEGPGYPAWTPNPDSRLLGTAQAVFRRVFDDDPKVKAVHAGLECGIIGAKFDGMDMVSFGPTILGAHSPSERVNIRSVEGFWTFLTAMLDALSG